MKTTSLSLLSSSAILLALASTGHAQAQSQPMSVRDNTLGASSIQGMTAPKYSRSTPMGGVDYGDHLGNHEANQDLDMSGFGAYNLKDPTADRPDMAANKRYVDQTVLDGKDNLGNHNAERNISMGGFQIQGLGAPTSNSAAATKKYVDDAVLAGKDNLGDHTATSNLDLDNHRIIDVATPVDPNDAATKSYVDSVGLASQDNLGNHTATLNLNMSGNKIVGVADPTASSDAATKGYVDSATSTINTNIGTLNGRRITAGTGLTGGGTLAADVTIGFDQGWGDARYVRNTLQIIAGSGLSGGGALSANRTLAVDGTVVRTTGTQTIGGDKTFSNGIDNGGNTLTGVDTPANSTDAANKGYVDTQITTVTNNFTNLSNRNINTNNGLIGGGNLSADRTLGLTGQALAFHNLATNGLVARTAAGAVAGRTIAVAAGGGITVTNGNGVAGNPTLSVDGTVVRTTDAQTIAGVKTFSDGINNGNRVLAGVATPVAAADAANKGYVDSAISAATSDAVRTSRSILAGAGLTGGGNLSADRTLSLTGQALALHNLGTSGIVTRTAAGTFAARSLTGVAGGGMTIANGDGIAGNPSLSVDGTVVRTTGAQTIAGAKTFTAAIAMSNQKITGLGAPILAADAATKAYVDAAIAGAGGSYTAGSGLTLTGSQFTVDTSVVRTTGVQSIDGKKTFTTELDNSAGQIRIRNGNTGSGMILRNDGTNTYILHTSAGAAETGTWNTLRPMTINNSTGQVDIGHGLRVQGGSAAEGSFYSGTTNPSSQSRLNFNGALFATRYYSSMYLYFSDRTLKKDIETLSTEVGIETVRQLNPVSYLWKKDGKLAWGVIAQEIQQVMPHAVEDSGNGILAVDYQQIIAPMLAAIQDLDDRAAKSDARVKSLEARLEKLETK